MASTSGIFQTLEATQIHYGQPKRAKIVGHYALGRLLGQGALLESVSVVAVTALISLVQAPMVKSRKALTCARTSASPSRSLHWRS